jgi:hypothetical protein
MDALGRDDSPRTVGELIGELARETSTLVRQEVHLAKVEMAQKAVDGAKQASYVGVGGLLGIIALQALLAALVFGLAQVMPLWASALLVGGTLAVVAFFVTWKGWRSLKTFELKPRQTLLSIEDTKSWARQQLQ